MSNKIGFGVIGCGGRVGHLVRGMLNTNDRVEMVSVCDPSEASIDRAKTLNPDVKVFDDYTQLVADPAIKWVFVGSWNAQHREHAIAALQAGKHVFCEKPLATTLEDCLAMRDAWQASDQMFFMGFVLRYAPLYERIKKEIDAGVIGKLISMEFNENLTFNHGGFIHADWRRLTENAGTHLLEKCCHDIDLAHWIVQSLPVRVASFGGLDFFTPENVHHVDRIGPSKDGKQAFMVWPSVTGENPFTADKDIIDNQVAILEFANGVRSTFHANCSAGFPERRMLLLGTEGAIRADLVKGIVESTRIGWDEPVTIYDTKTCDGHGGGDQILVDKLGECMASENEPRAVLDDGLKAAITCFGIDESMETGQVVDLRPTWEQVGIDVDAAVTA